MIGRRQLFARVARKAGENAVRQMDGAARRKARHWIRPPFALPELEFLLACTRCDACVSACSHGVIFKLPARAGASAAATPALDLLNKACRLCAGWPCVEACEAGALRIPPSDGRSADATLPALSLPVIDEGACLPYRGPECGACASSCPVPGALRWDGVRPSIEASRCIGCGSCRQACVVDPPAIAIIPIEATHAFDT